MSGLKSTSKIVNVIKACSAVVNVIKANVTLINGGVGTSACPIIISIDGGNAATTSYPQINGLLNGGTA